VNNQLVFFDNIAIFINNIQGYALFIFMLVILFTFKQKKKILKVDLYMNLLKLMETGKMHLFNDEEILYSLSSVQYEYNDKGEIRIFGNDTHICEALIRAVWCMNEKHLNLWCYY